MNNLYNRTLRAILRGKMERANVKCMYFQISTLF